MRCHTWTQAEAGGMLEDVLHHAGRNGPQLIRADDGTEHVVVTRAAYATTLDRLGERFPDVTPHRAATRDEIDRHLEEFCDVPLDLGRGGPNP